MRRHQLGFVVTVAALAGMSAFVAAQGSYTPPRTPWGDPDIQGAYTNSNESQTPMERPKELEGRRLEDISPDELSRLNQQRNQARVKADEAALGTAQPAALVREPRLQEHTGLDGHRPARRPHPAGDAAGAGACGGARRRRAKDGARPIPTRIAASTTAASAAASQDR